jgi:hypothetical protein
MIHRWRSEIETGRKRAEQLGDDMTALAWSAIRTAFVVGFVIGAILSTGAMLWLTR